MAGAFLAGAGVKGGSCLGAEYPELAFELGSLGGVGGSLEATSLALLMTSVRSFLAP